MEEHAFSVVLLAAGKATRFKSERSKLLHEVAGRPLGEYLVRAALATKPERAYMIIGHGAEELRSAFASFGLTFIEQKQQLGTGHALMISRSEIEACPSPALVVLVGDAPLLRSETIQELVETHNQTGAAATVLTTAVCR
jgi:bifunctional N-acetylglucosamine-1-phosphate-uridyltransferase/glucosamine-1-phosphate-acetyltransferase GlmU-like protein